MLQSAVSRLLVELVFDPYFVGLPSDVAEKVKEVESFLASSSKTASQTTHAVCKAD
jgi:hypothetical protein